MVELLKQTQLQKVFVANLLEAMKFEVPLSWHEFEEAIEIINIKAAASQQMAREMKKKGKSGGIIGGLVKPFGPDKAGKDGTQYNTYYTSNSGLGSPRTPDDLSSSDSGVNVRVEDAGDDRSELPEPCAEDDELYEFG